MVYKTRYTEKYDFSDSKEAPVLVCFVKKGNKYLLLKRSDKVLGYKNMWSNLSGFLDTDEDLKVHVIRELNEEIGISVENIISINEIDTYDYVDKNMNRVWKRHLVLVSLDTEEITIDWEHTDYRWVCPDDVGKFNITPGLIEDLYKVQSFGKNHNIR